MLRNFLGKPRNMSLIICAHPNEQVFEGGDKANNMHIFTITRKLSLQEIVPK